ncbi:hypothetical protein BX600DRAFT_482462 [Xylariales sp. PMI_506]|nr:hypothetical protein BX600DRAFT_482462 [Xylariales sp. PMI_506]
MPAPGRRNACYACMRAKRACNRQDPQCGRCVERGIECVSSGSSRSTKRKQLAARPDLENIGEAVPSETAYRPPAPTASLGTISWGVYDPAWFLAQPLWIPEHNYDTTRSFPSKLYKEFIQDLLGWLREWATYGRSPFIHPQMYQSGLPSSLQDAYTTLVAYLAKNEETEEVVLQIVESRATGLVQQSRLLEGIEPLDLKAHLARTQALLMYTMVRLTDGCPRQRSLAEDQLPILRHWCNRMREVAVQAAPILHNKLMDGFENTCDLELAIWRAWILSESVRRTWFVATTVAGIYELIKGDTIGCTGGFPFTARQGLWDAKSATIWTREMRKNGPLLTSCRSPLELTRTASPLEVDTFSHQFLQILVGPDQMEHWFEKYAEP